MISPENVNDLMPDIGISDQELLNLSGELIEKKIYDKFQFSQGVFFNQTKR